MHSWKSALRISVSSRAVHDECSDPYSLCIKRNEKVLAVRHVSQGMVAPFTRDVTPQMMPPRYARRETSK